MAVDSGSTAFILVSMALVLFMTPGLAFFYGGLVRSTTVNVMIMQNMICMSVLALVWAGWGFSMCFSEMSPFIGSPTTYGMFAGLGGEPILGLQIPGLLFAGYQGMFAVITPALITGAFADRVRFPAHIAIMVLWLQFCYIPFCHMVWGPGGFLATAGVVDFAGGIVVHAIAGFSSLASVVALPAREKVEGKAPDTDPHNVPFVALGTGILWFGWFGFNGGSALGATDLACYAAVNTNLSAAACTFVWMLIEWKHTGKPTLVGTCVAMVAGLVLITPGCGFVKPWAAIVIGALGTPICYTAVHVANKCVDDALDVWAVHGMGGVWGTIAIGLFADPTVNPAMGIEAGGAQLLKQTLAVGFAAVYAFVVTFILVKVLSAVMQVLPTSDEYKETLDVAFHDNKAYVTDSGYAPVAKP